MALFVTLLMILATIFVLGGLLVWCFRTLVVTMVEVYNDLTHDKNKNTENKDV